MSKARFVLAVGVCLPAICQAGPPFVTDDPEPVEYHEWEVNYALTGTHGGGQTTGFLPQVDANYGIAHGVQFHMQPQMAFSSGPDGHSYGIGDTEVGVKYRLTPESEHPEDWMVSLYPIYKIPTGNENRNLGAGAGSLYLPVWFQSTRGKWQMYGGGGYSINGGTDSKNNWAAGWVTLYQFTDKLQFGGEVFAKTADTVDGRTSSGFSLGGTYGLSKGYNLLFSAGRGLANATATNQASAYLGLQVHY